MKFREAFKLGACVGFGVIGYDVVIAVWHAATYTISKKLDERKENGKEEE